MSNCKICNTPTPYRFNINQKDIHICDKCASGIMLQWGSFLASKDQYINISDRNPVLEQEIIFQTKAGHVYSGCRTMSSYGVSIFVDFRTGKARKHVVKWKPIT